MESVIIATPMPYEHVFIERLRRGGMLPTPRGLGGIVVQAEGSRVYIYEAAGLRDEMEPEHVARLDATIRNPTYYIVDYSDLTVCKRVLCAIADDADIVVDNDHGVILPGRLFIASLRSRADWDWRAE